MGPRTCERRRPGSALPGARARPTSRSGSSRLNEGVSGSGNALSRCRVCRTRAPHGTRSSRTARSDGARVARSRHCPRGPDGLRPARRRRGGAHHRGAARQPQRANAGPARRHRRAVVHPRPVTGGPTASPTSDVSSPLTPAYSRSISEPAIRSVEPPATWA